MLWARVHLHTADFIHFHRHGSTYGAPINASVDIRVQLGIRILNDASQRAALGGPSSDPTVVRSGRYHLRFNAKSGSTYERCIDDLVRFVVEQGEPWFQRFVGNTEDLLTVPDSELQPSTKELLKAGLSGQPDANSRAASLKLLGIRKT